MESLYEKLERYGNSDFYGFHMPGHKRQFAPYDFYRMDITEIDGFDDLHHPEGCLRDVMEEMRQFYQSDRTWMLVNGSTCGILAAISAVTDLGDEILVARNCHKSVYHALYLRNLKAHYIYPAVDCSMQVNLALSVRQVEQAILAHPKAKVLVMVSPTYEGVVSDIRAIASLCHVHGVCLIVDEAHGAHFIFSAHFPESALQSGADMVIQSFHKTLPSLTQTAVLHLKSDLVGAAQVERHLRIYQSSSPSYLLMGSVVECFRYMTSEAGVRQMQAYVERLHTLRAAIGELGNIRLLGENVSGGYDESKLVFAVRGMNGQQTADWLREQEKLELEMSTPFYALAMTSLCDSWEGLERLLAALKRLNVRVEGVRERKNGGQSMIPLVSRMSYYEAMEREGMEVTWEESVGRVSQDMLYVYPPGIPFVVPGEYVTREIMEQLRFYVEQGYEVHGTSTAGKMRVVV